MNILKFEVDAFSREDVSKFYYELVAFLSYDYTDIRVDFSNVDTTSSAVIYLKFGNLQKKVKYKFQILSRFLESRQVRNMKYVENMYA